jgi:hypothetical protein
MLTRRAFVAASLLCSNAFAKEGDIFETLSIGVGPFEFPIAGKFKRSVDRGATVLATLDGARIYTVGLLRGPGPPSDDRMSVLELPMRRSWEKFVAEERGTIVREFRRTDVSRNLAIFSMASELTTSAGLQYYVQFAASTGDSVATLFAEGLGPAQPVLQELEPMVAKVRVVR